eukprot:316501-Prorocentrum_minimum.AAC.1
MASWAVVQVRSSAARERKSGQQACFLRCCPLVLHPSEVPPGITCGRDRVRIYLVTSDRARIDPRVLHASEVPPGVSCGRGAFPSHLVTSDQTRVERRRFGHAEHADK